MCRRSVGLHAPYAQLQFFLFPLHLSNMELTIAHKGHHPASSKKFPGIFLESKLIFQFKALWQPCPLAQVTLLGACSAVSLKLLIILIMNTGRREDPSAMFPASLHCVTGAWRNSVCLCQPCALRQRDQT